ncbi:MAG: alpha/beta hydrolase [Bacteriovoracaceae bacterium]|nr:alpha/beta hydrolase [Bacteriovoracaceae bacterium]
MLKTRISSFFLFILLGCSYGLYKPEQNTTFNPGKLHLIYQDYFFKTKDGVLLHSWKVQNQRNEDPKTTIIFFHDSNGNIGTHLDNLAWLTLYAHDIFIFDYRGYGKSEGKPDPEGTYLDGLAALNEGVQWGIKRGSKKIIVYGQGLGGIVATRSLFDFKRQNEISLLVLESSYDSYSTVSYFQSNKMGTKDILKNFNMPKLIIHGTRDQEVSYEAAVQMYENASNPKWFWSVDQGKHLDAYFIQDGKYRKDFLDFLEHNI